MTSLFGTLLRVSLAVTPLPSLPVDTAKAAPPSCAEDLNLLKTRLEQNYAGYTLEIVGDRRREYDRLVQRSREAAGKAKDDGCFFVLQDFLNWFDDPHLFIYQNNALDSAESVRRAKAVRTVDLDESRLRRQLLARIDRLDPIEGIWYDRELRVGIIQDPAGPRNKFIAVVLHPDSSSWRTGTVRGEFVRNPKGGYQAQVYGPNYSMRYQEADIYRRVLLRLTPGIWGKAFPVGPADSGQVDPYDPHRPTLWRKPGTVIVTLPSHDPGFIPLLDSLLKANAGALDSADRFIIDLRGNEGGASFVSDALYPWFVSAGMPSAPELRQSEALMLSSPDQIRYAKYGFGSDTSAFVRSLVERLSAAPGKLVLLRDPAAPARPETPYPPPQGHARVGILIDRGTVSASEVVVLDARQSSRVTVFGEPTAGALDYQSVNVVRLSNNEDRWYFGYPTITRNDRLPRDGMRGKGIQPDVKLDWAHLSDPIATVEQILASRKD